MSPVPKPLGHVPDLPATARAVLAAHPPPGTVLLCALVGSHAHGTAGPDSDLDLGAVHLAPTRQALGLFPGDDSHSRIATVVGQPCDLSSHELAPALRLVCGGSGNLAERILASPLLVAGPAAEELRALVQGALSRRLVAHYQGHFRGLQKAHLRDGQCKSLLSGLRVALTGLALLRTGRLETAIGPLAAAHAPDPAATAALVALRQAGPKDAAVPPALGARIQAQWPALLAALDGAATASPLPPAPPNVAALDDFVVRQRLAAARAEGA